MFPNGGLPYLSVYALRQKSAARRQPANKNISFYLSCGLYHGAPSDAGEYSSGGFYLTGSYWIGNTHLMSARYRQMVIAGKTRCHVRTIRELVQKLSRAEFDDIFLSPVIMAAAKMDPYHFFWDNIDKLKPTNFKTEVLFDLVDSLYRQNHSLTVTSNYSMRNPVEWERLHPAIVRRLDNLCRIL